MSCDLQFFRKHYAKVRKPNKEILQYNFNVEQRNHIFVRFVMHSIGCVKCQLDFDDALSPVNRNLYLILYNNLLIKTSPTILSSDLSFITSGE